MNIVKRDIPNLEVYYVPIKGFKTIETFFVYTGEIYPKEFNERNFLSEILLETSKNYPTTEKLRFVCDNLYGLTKVGYYHFEGGLNVTMFISSAVNDKYLDEFNVFSDSFDLLVEMIYNPRLYNGVIPKKVVREKKINAKETLLSIKQNKNAYTYYQFMQAYMRNNQEYFANLPDEENLRTVTSESITDNYNKMITDENLKIFIGGDFDFSEMDKIIHAKSTMIKANHQKNYQFNPTFKGNDQVNTVVEKTSSGQTRIYIGYNLDFPFNKKNSNIMSLFNEIFGGFENSKLFSVIREKLHLSYYVYSYYSKGNNLFFVNLETNKENEDKAISVVNKLLEEAKTGLIDDDLFLQAKMNLINRLETSVDSQSKMMIHNIIDYIRFNESFDIKNRIEDILNITKEELVELIKNIKIDTTYIYTNGDN